MELITKAIKGTQDILPKDSYKWKFIFDLISNECENVGLREIRTPVFEHTELFQRSVGDASDIVQKEMYTFNDKGGRSITLRPEGTAGTVRAILENGVYNEGLPLKVYYLDSCYRYEKPQAGRLREFHQFGVEVFGTDDPLADAEIIVLADSIFNRIGLKNISLEINSIGCADCRKEYYKALKSYVKDFESKLCPTCIERMERNPMRILDCKNDSCISIAKHAPMIIDFICQDCKEHFELVKDYLSTLEIDYKVNPRIVRGLDYYNRTVFEFVSSEIGSQGTVCGGGRYDTLVGELSGKQMPALGFGIGFERLMLLIEKVGIALPMPKSCELYVASIGEKARKRAFKLVKEVRSASLSAECDISNRSLKAQMKYADKIKAKFSIVLGLICIIYFPLFT